MKVGQIKRSPETALDRRKFVKLLAGSAAAASLPLSLSSCRDAAAAGGRRAIVLGLDGLDPSLLQMMIKAGRAPNFKRLAELGSFTRLGTTMPALSPVAWSSFITGMSPGQHGIADFLMRDPKTYSPVFSIYKNQEPDVVFDFGDYHMPLKGGGPVNLRKGKPFWAYLTERGIPATVSKIPTNYPVDESATYALAGMGTPDLAGAYGQFTYYTSNQFEHYPDVEGGFVLYVEPGNVQHLELIGPQNPLVTPGGVVSEAKLPFSVYLDPDRDLARLEIQGQSVILEKGKLSEWVKVSFEMMPHLSSVGGIARFLLKGVRPHFQLYVTPINIDPEDAAQAGTIAYPASYGADIARSIGSFWTKGLPADTKAFDYGIINDEEYVQQAEEILRERIALFDHQWSRFNDGLFYFYVSSTDQDAHMLWRNMDPSHPLHKVSDLRFSGFIPHLYEEMDKLVGKVLPAIDDKTLLLICSDHGFTQFGRQLHLNTWLRDNGYLALRPGTERKKETSIIDIDWSKTAAYGIGFNGLYLNRKNREGKGIVSEDESEKLVQRISRELTAITDLETGKRPVAKVYRREEVYKGDLIPEMPEMLVGYTPGYRSASSSVLGATGKEIIDVNPWAWSGDHSMAHEMVPGTLMSSLPVKHQSPSILDLPVTILDFFGIDKPQQMDGKSILRG
jgi:predicted AlkP superfamily phosphohydrolase/phosphomutase